MFQDYEQNENYRYNNKDNIYPYTNEGNIINYSNNNPGDYNYYNNNYNNYSQNNNYNNNFNNETLSQNSIITEKKETINSSTIKTKTIDSINNRYFSKVEVENIRQPKDIIYMLDNFLAEINYPKNYEINTDKNKISFIFFEEEIAFKFTKYLNSIKNRNVLYTEMNVHLSLTPNNNYNKIKDGKDLKKRGLSVDSIQRLFNGLGSRKQEKKNKINPNLDLGVSSPFLYPYEKKRQKKMKKTDDNSFSHEKLKDYIRLPIRVLDTNYKPLKSHDFRPEAKDKWVSPTNFKF